MDVIIELEAIGETILSIPGFGAWTNIILWSTYQPGIRTLMVRQIANLDSLTCVMSMWHTSELSVQSLKQDVTRTLESLSYGSVVLTRNQAYHAAAVKLGMWSNGGITAMYILLKTVCHPIPEVNLTSKLWDSICIDI